MRALLPLYSLLLLTLLAFRALPLLALFALHTQLLFALTPLDLLLLLALAALDLLGVALALTLHLLRLLYSAPLYARPFALCPGLAPFHAGRRSLRGGTRDLTDSTFSTPAAPLARITILRLS